MMLETIDIINLIDHELQSRNFPKLIAHYGFWSVGPMRLRLQAHVLFLENHETVQLNELRIPSHIRYARLFAQDLADKLV